jgi:YD repeat-containing protein
MTSTRLPNLVQKLLQAAGRGATYVALLLAPLVSTAGNQQVWANGNVTFPGIIKGDSVTLNITYVDPSDAGDATEGELNIQSVTVTVSGTTLSATVDATNRSQTLYFLAPQDSPVVSVSVTYVSGSGSASLNDGDEGGALLVWNGIEKDSGEPPHDACCGDPINALTGNSFQKEIDYQGAGDFPLTFVRYYNSINANHTSAFGNAWSHTYNQNLLQGHAQRADGPTYGSPQYSVVDPDAPVVAVQFAGYPGSQLLNKQTNVLESYDATTGRLLALYDLKGNSQTMAYDGGGHLSAVTHSNGRSLQFTYDGAGRIATMTDPTGAIYVYGYDANNNLTSVTHPDQSTRQYAYGNASFAHAMTGLIDELGNTFATWTYDANGYAVTSSVGGGLVVENATAPVLGSDTRTITNGAGTTRTLLAATVNGKRLPGVVTTQSAAATSQATHTAYYDSHANVLVRTNNNGSQDCFTYNSKDQETNAIFDGAQVNWICSGKVDARFRTSTWHPYLYARSAVAEPQRLTYVVYHQQPDPTNGNATASCITPSNSATAPYLNVVCKQTVYSTTDVSGWYGIATSRIDSTVAPDVHTFTYDPSGRVLSATDALGKATQFAYYPDTTTNHTTGDLQSITNNLGQVLTFNIYDKNGRALQFTDPNGLATAITYDYRGNVLSRQVGVLRTGYIYDAAGQLKTVQSPDGTSTTLTYDLAHRVSTITDNAGNSKNVTYDSTGNVATVTFKDGLGNTVKTAQYTYDYLNNMIKSIGDGQ